MNFLELCKRTRSEVGYSGTGPSSVIDQLGEMGRLVNKVNSAWLEIQQARPNWSFMKTSYSGPLTAETLTIADLKGVDEDSFLIIESGVSYPLRYSTKDDLRYAGDLTAMPTHFWHERGKIHVWPTPDKTYTLVGDYFKIPTLMALSNTSVPTMASEYHEAIVWLAAKQLGAFEESANTFNNASMEYRRLFNRILQNETPRISFCGPMA